MDSPPSEFPARGQLPVQASALVGRVRELSELLHLLHSDARLITLTGMGGIGKTRLALEAAHRVESRLPGGAFFASLASFRDPTLVAGAIAESLGVREPALGSVEEIIVERLSGRRSLMLLDNFEHLPDAAPLVETLLARCSEVRFLITSRVPLRLAGESVFPLGPLEIPDPTNLPNMNTLRGVESIELFLARAVEAYHRFSITEQSAPAIAAICAKVGGLPLAIELVAARCRHATPQSLLELMGDTLPLLTGNSGGVPERQRTMRATLTWSYALLDEPHKRLFERVAVHAGGFDLDAARAVMNAAPSVDIDVFDGIGDLLDHGLLTREDQPDGSTRYGMLEPVREFALEGLGAAGHLETTQIAHARYFTDLAEKMRANAQSNNGSTALAWFIREEANFRAAVGIFIRKRRSYLARGLVLALWRFWWKRHRLQEGQRSIDAAIELFDPAHPDELEPELRYAAAMIALARNDVRHARTHATSGIEAAKLTGDEFWQAALLTILAHAAAHSGDHRRAINVYQIALKTIYPLRTQNPYASEILASTHLVMATMYFKVNELLDAEYHSNEALRISMRVADPEGIGLAKLHIASIASVRGELPRAVELYQESLSLVWEAGDERAMAEALAGLSGIALAQGLIETGAQLLGAAEVLRATGTNHGLPLIESDRASALSRLRDLTSTAITEKGMEKGRKRARQDVIVLIDEAIAAILARLAPPKRGTSRIGEESLSRREREVLCLMVEGMSDRQIADALFVGYRTVTTHAEHIYGKFGVNSRAAAVAYALRHGLC